MTRLISFSQPWRLILALLLVALEAPTLNSAEIPLRVNCSGPSLGKPGSDGYWQSDKTYATAGEDYLFTDKISTKGVKNAAPEKLYQTVRRDNPAWHFKSVPDGLYLVRLHMSDANKKAARQMSFWFQEDKLIQNLSITAAAGGAGKAYVHEVVVQVSGGTGLKIRGSRGAGDDAFVAGIEMLPAPKGAKPTPALEDDSKRPDDLAARIKKFTGAATRIVWSRADNPADIFGEKREAQLLGFDTEDGRGERCILSQPDSYARPLITPDGQRIVVSNVATHICYVVNFDGTGLHEFAQGFAACLWSDPKTKETWVCVREKEGSGKTEVIVRRKLDHPEVAVRIWTTADNGESAMSHFGLMNDGIHAVDCNPWPIIGTIDVERGRFKSVTNGCWPSVCPDETGRFFTFRGNHRSIYMFDKLKSDGRIVKLDTVPNAPLPTVYHPRWTNHPQFITVTSPLGHPQSKLFIGKFDDRYSSIQEWRQITYSDKPDSFGNAWIANGATAPSSAKPAESPSEPKDTPTVNHQAGLVFVWQNQRSDNAITDEQGKTVRLCRMTMHGKTRPSPTQGADIREGALIADEESSRALAAATSKTGALTLSFVTQISDATKDGVVVCYGMPGKPAALMVEQKSGELVATLTADGRTSVTLGKIMPNAPQHWAVVIEKTGIRSLKDGKLTARKEGPVSMKNWVQASLHFGRDADGGNSWRGWIEGIEILDRALSDQEIEMLHDTAAAEWSKRKPAPRIVVEAELVESSKTPDPVNIRPYLRSLAENLYKVRKVISGELKDERIIVLQWCILDSQKVDAHTASGNVVTLTLEPEDSHPELSGENRSSDLSDPGLTLLYDINS